MRALPVEVLDDMLPIIPGPLQLAILRVLWRHDRMRLMDLWQAVRAIHGSDTALSTVSTTLTRLLRRGWVARPKSGYYAAVLDRDQLIDLIAEYLERD